MTCSLIRRCLPLFAVCAAAGASAAPRLNVVFIIADDLGYADIGSYGNTYVETPRLDRFASESMRFSRCYTSGPACMPTRASLQSGKYPIRLYRWVKQLGKLGDVAPWDPLPLEETTFAETLEKAGYATGYIGKWHLGAEELFPDKQGYDWMAASGKYWKLPCFFHPYRVEQLEGQPDRGYLTHVLTGEAEGYLESRKGKSEPFFLFVSHYAPHIPIQGEPAVVEKYRKKAEGHPTPCDPVYAAMVEALDVSVGRILDKLQALGLAENTVVMFTSDNGGYLGDGDAPADGSRKKKKKGKEGEKPELPSPCDLGIPRVTTNTPLRDGKASLYEGGIRVPLLIRWPGATRAGAVSDVPVITMDLYPTFLAAGGVAADPRQPLDGESLLPVLRGQGVLKRDALFFIFGPAAVVRGTDKLIVFPKEGRRELYDLAADPGEAHDLLAARPTLAVELSARIDRWFAETLPAVK